MSTPRPRFAHRPRLAPSVVRGFASAGVALVLSTSVQAAPLWVEPEAKPPHEVSLPSLSPLVEKSERAVLSIETVARLPDGELPPGHPPLGRDGRPPEVRGEGSGFLIHPSGLALTNYHVVEGALAIEVRVGPDPIAHKARIIGEDKKSDVALLQLEGDRKDWPAVPLGDSSSLRVGDFVVAIGNPFGLSQSVSMGILSAEHRKNIAPSGRSGLYDFLQTDASINPGNSGGPLLNLRGEVVGINTAINAAANGIGFAIPINMVKRMLPSLHAEGRVVRSWIGIGIQPISDEIAPSFGLDRARGALVRHVSEGGPAAAAGVRPGDVVVRFDKTAIEEASDLPLLAGEAGVGETVSLELLRGGTSRAVSVTLGQHPDTAPRRTSTTNLAKPSAAEPAADRTRARKLGVKLTTLGPNERARLRLPASVEGVVVLGVAPRSPAMAAGLLPDDVIVRVGGTGVNRAAALADLLKRTPAGDVLHILVLRRGSEVFLPLVRP